MQFNHDSNKSWSQALYDKLQQCIDHHQLAAKYAEMTELINATGDDEFDLIWDYRVLLIYTLNPMTQIPLTKMISCLGIMQLRSTWNVMTLNKFKGGYNDITQSILV